MGTGSVGVGGWRKTWRMTGSAPQRWTLRNGPEAVKGRGLGRGVGRRLCLARDLADDGKRFDALDGACRAGGNDRGGSSREGSGGPILLETRLGGDPADDGKRFDAVDVPRPEAILL